MTMGIREVKLSAGTASVAREADPSKGVRLEIDSGTGLRLGVSLAMGEARRLGEALIAVAGGCDASHPALEADTRGGAVTPARGGIEAVTTIQKYRFDIDLTEPFTLRIPEGSEILHVDAQDGKPCLWAHIDPSRPVVGWRFRLYGTGHRIEGVGAHVATFQMPPYVWHLFFLGVLE